MVFLNCSIGGTGISQWQKNAGTGYYQTCLDAATGTVISAFYHDQGEWESEGGSDNTQKWADAWVSSTTQFYHDLRADLNVSSNTPVYFARLGDFEFGQPYRALMRTNQATLSMPGSHMLNLDGIPDDPNSLNHYTFGGYDAISDRLATLFLANPPP